MGDRSVPKSLAVRLSWWYGISSCLLIAIVTGFLYLALLRNFDQQNAFPYYFGSSGHVLVSGPAWP
jgi:hypothetical protein